MFKLRIKNNKYTISLFLVLVCNTYFFYLVDHAKKIAGVALEDWGLLLAIIWGISIWCKLLHCSNPKYEFGPWMLCALVMIFLSGIEANRLFGQNIIRGISPQRYFLVWTLLYFPIRKCIHLQKIKREDLIKLLTIISLVQLLIYTLQLVLRNHIIFTYVGMHHRYGTPRFYFADTFLLFLYFMALDKVFARGEKKIRWWIYIACFLIVEIFCMQVRLSVLAIIACTGMFIVFRRDKIDRKIAILFLGLILFAAMCTTTLVQDAITTVLTQKWDAGTEIRFTGKEIFWETIKKHPILGAGYPNINCESAIYAMNRGDERILLQDNGVMAVMYIFGTVGLIWVVSWMGKMFKMGRYIYRKTDIFAYMLPVMFCLFVCINQIPFYWQFTPVGYCIFMCIEEVHFCEVKYDCIRT